MAIKKSLIIILASSVIGVLVYWFMRFRRRELPGISTWQKVFAEKYGDAKAYILIEQVRQNYKRLLRQRSLPENPILRRHTTENILPGLALFQVLRKEYDQTKALEEVDQYFRVSMLKRNRFLMAPLKYLPNSFGLFKLVMGLRMKSFSPEGWDFEYIENSDERIAFNVTRCFYLKTLSEYGAPELTASFCKTDDVVAELFPPSIRFIRPKTLGQGEVKCDFQYCHVL